MHQNPARPRAIFIMWLQSQNKLLTKDRLSKWGISVERKCIICKRENETRNHLFNEFDYTRQLWKRSTNLIQMQYFINLNWKQTLDLVTKISKRKNKRAKCIKMIYAEFIHSIWMERNTRIFEKEEKS